jgi:hypothetical protein
MERALARTGAAVTRYYLHFRQGGTLSRDLEGEEFDDLGHARREAVCSARELAAAAITNNEPVGGQIEVEDGDGKTRATVLLRDVIDFES